MADGDLVALLPASGTVGSIRTRCPTLYVFSGGNEDATFFTINGFSILLDGGDKREVPFWNLIRNYDKVSTVLMTRSSPECMRGLATILARKAQEECYPAFGSFIGNLPPRDTTNGESELAKLVRGVYVGLQAEGLKPIEALANPKMEPITLYEVIGEGALRMTVLHPERGSKELGALAAALKAGEPVEKLSVASSIAVLLVWHPSDPSKPTTRVLFPGACPLEKLYAALEKLKGEEYLRHVEFVSADREKFASNLSLNSRGIHVSNARAAGATPAHKASPTTTRPSLTQKAASPRTALGSARGGAPSARGPAVPPAPTGSRTTATRTVVTETKKTVKRSTSPSSPAAASRSSALGPKRTSQGISSKPKGSPEGVSSKPGSKPITNGGTKASAAGTPKPVPIRRSGAPGAHGALPAAKVKESAKKEHPVPEIKESAVQEEIEKKVVGEVHDSEAFGVHDDPNLLVSISPEVPPTVDTALKAATVSPTAPVQETAASPLMTAEAEAAFSIAEMGTASSITQAAMASPTAEPAATFSISGMGTTSPIPAMREAEPVSPVAAVLETGGVSPITAGPEAEPVEVPAMPPVVGIPEASAVSPSDPALSPPGLTAQKSHIEELLESGACPFTAGLVSQIVDDATSESLHHQFSPSDTSLTNASVIATVFDSYGGTSLTDESAYFTTGTGTSLPTTIASSLGNGTASSPISHGSAAAQSDNALDDVIESLAGESELEDHPKSVATNVHEVPEAPKHNGRGDLFAMQDAAQDVNAMTQFLPSMRTQARTGTGGAVAKPKLSQPLYFDVVFVPHHGPQTALHDEAAAKAFAISVRSKRYIISGEEAIKTHILDGFIAAKNVWNKPELEIDVLPTHSSDMLSAFNQLKAGEMSEAGMNLRCSVDRCTLRLSSGGSDDCCAAFKFEM